MNLIAGIQKHFEGTFPGLLGIELSEVSPSALSAAYWCDLICVRLGNTRTEGR